MHYHCLQSVDVHINQPIMQNGVAKQEEELDLRASDEERQAFRHFMNEAAPESDDSHGESSVDSYAYIL
jgi:hypothetical protein